MGKKNKISNDNVNQQVQETRVGGRLIRDDGPIICKHCQGDRGWHEKGNALVHTGCGKVQ